MEVCAPFPAAPKPIEIPLPFGGSLKSIPDISQGMPTDCSMAQSLMLQIAPMLAGMTCIMRVLAVIKDLKDVITDSPPFINAGAVPKFIEDAAKLSQCFLLLDPTKIICMVAGILKMIVSYISCLIEALSSILNFQAGIDLNAADGNPVLLANLQCAQQNSQNAMQGMMGAMEGIQPLIELMNMLMEIIGQEPIELSPTAFQTPSPGELLDMPDPLKPLKDVRDALQTVLNALPC
jgi:hypothetical protein